ncbi:hypothetical protein LPTSP3_g06900 [Leptospira kobayashii]|uniref:Lipoprotein n=2 Tax=Leptospira kobayashii TaxID=1917830 RepID=A0ABM7URF8_9LEPT|nr:hypothetical protein LPTSP3_g06900 [Leptospira kobayashii]
MDVLLPDEIISIFFYIFCLAISYFPLRIVEKIKVTKMKIKCLILFVVISMSNCVLLNPVGLNIDREKGSEAASRIREAAITIDLVNTLAATGGRAAGISILSLIADDIAGIDAAKYYVRSDVDSCVKDIKGLTGFVVGSTIANLISCRNLKTDGYLTGDPLPKL